jgi:hypothetical protein
MSSFYDDASLIIIPSGYKTSKIYAEKPTDGSGDLTFTRASGATRVASNGLIEEVRTNLILQSNDFSNASWTKLNGVTVSATRVADPFGGTTAWQLIYNGTTDGRLEQNVVGFTGQGTQSVWLRVSAGTQIVKIGAVGGSTVSATVTTTWTRYSATTTGGNFPRILCDANTTIQAYGCQFEAGDIATNYIPTTTAAVSVGPVSNVPRLDYTNSSCPRLLLEPQRTNLATFSEQFNNAAWTKSNATVTANTSVSPDGYASADTLTVSAGGYLYFQVVSYSAVSGQSVTLSLFAKNQINNFLVIGGATTAGTDVYRIENYGNGWYRHILTRTFTATASTTLQYIVATVGTHIIWGAQIEAGSYATSYIPTLSASVTRVADAASKTGISSLIGQTEGTIFLDVRAVLDTTTNQDYSVSDGTTNNRALIRLNNSGLINAIGVFGGSVEFNMGTTPYVAGSRYKIALAYKLNDIALYVNGVQAATDNTATISGTLSRFGFDVGTGVAPIISPVNQALIFKTRLTNAQLAELTTL